MEWLNEPGSWQRNGDVLRISVDPGTDFWRATGYGYIHDNGHVYGDRLPGDLDVSVRVRGAFASQYDQAGIMLRADEQIWLKTGLEFFEGRPRLSTVLTLGWSSWMVADLPPGTDEVTLRVSRRAEAVEVRYSAGDGAAELAALVFMPADRELLAGIVCAAPEGTGFSVAFHDLRVVGREWSGQEAADGADWAGAPAARADGWAPVQAAGWAGDTDGEAEPGWAGETDREAEPGWAGDRPGSGITGWARGRPGDQITVWTGDTPDDEAGDQAGEKPNEKTTGGKPAGGVPDGWDDELPGDESLDWAKPQASEPSADWERLSQSLSTTSWNAFAAATPAPEAEEPARERPGQPAVAPAGRGGEDGAGEPPEAAAGDQAEPGVDPAGAPAAGKPDETARGKNGRGRNKGKQPMPPALPSPADPADEWISLLTADAAEELSASDPAEEPAGPGPAGELAGPAGKRADGEPAAG